MLTGRAESPTPASSTGPKLLPRVSPAEVQHLLAGAQLVVCNGGTTMVHALAHGRPLVAVALASDQGRRIRLAVKLGVAATASRSPSAIASEAAALLKDAPRRDQMTRRIAELGIANGVDEAVAALIALARRASSGRPA